MVANEIAIKPRGPFSWDAANDVGRTFEPVRHNWQEAGAVRMTFLLDGTFAPVGVDLRYENGELRGEVAGTSDLAAVEGQVARVFSLDVDGSTYPEIGRRDPAIGRLMEALPGLRPVCFTSPYETAAWAVISQRISMRQAADIRSRLTADHGHTITLGGVGVRCFPTPERLLGVESIAGLAATKVTRLHGVARSALAGTLDCDRLRALGDEAGPDSVRVIPRIGPFWASGIYLRGCGIQDVFPDEPIAVAALGMLLGLGDRPAMELVRDVTARYAPFRTWVCFLLRVAINRGLIDGVAGNEMNLRRTHR